MALLHFFTRFRLSLTAPGWTVRRGFRTIAGPTRYHADAVLMLAHTLIVLGR